MGQKSFYDFFKAEKGVAWSMKRRYGISMDDIYVVYNIYDMKTNTMTPRYFSGCDLNIVIKNHKEWPNEHETPMNKTIEDIEHSFTAMFTTKTNVYIHEGLNDWFVKSEYNEDPIRDCDLVPYSHLVKLGKRDKPAMKIIKNYFKVLDESYFKYPLENDELTENLMMKMDDATIEAMFFIGLYISVLKCDIIVPSYKYKFNYKLTETAEENWGFFDILCNSKNLFMIKRYFKVEQIVRFLTRISDGKCSFIRKFILCKNVTMEIIEKFLEATTHYNVNMEKIMALPVLNIPRWLVKTNDHVPITHWYLIHCMADVMTDMVGIKTLFKRYVPWNENAILAGSKYKSDLHKIALKKKETHKNDMELQVFGGGIWVCPSCKYEDTKCVGYIRNEN